MRALLLAILLCGCASAPESDIATTYGTLTFYDPSREPCYDGPDAELLGLQYARCTRESRYIQIQPRQPGDEK